MKIRMNWGGDKTKGHDEEEGAGLDAPWKRKNLD